MLQLLSGNVCLCRIDVLMGCTGLCAAITKACLPEGQGISGRHPFLDGTCPWVGGPERPKRGWLTTPATPYAAPRMFLHYSRPMGSSPLSIATPDETTTVNPACIRQFGYTVATFPRYICALARAVQYTLPPFSHEGAVHPFTPVQEKRCYMPGKRADPSCPAGARPACRAGVTSPSRKGPRDRSPRLCLFTVR